MELQIEIGDEMIIANVSGKRLGLEMKMYIIKKLQKMFKNEKIVTNYCDC